MYLFDRTERLSSREPAEGNVEGASPGDGWVEARGWRRVRGSRHTGRAVERPFGAKSASLPSARYLVATKPRTLVVRKLTGW